MLRACLRPLREKQAKASVEITHALFRKTSVIVPQHQRRTRPSKNNVVGITEQNRLMAIATLRGEGWRSRPDAQANDTTRAAAIADEFNAVVEASKRR